MDELSLGIREDSAFASGAVYAFFFSRFAQSFLRQLAFLVWVIGIGLNGESCPLKKLMFSHLRLDKH